MKRIIYIASGIDNMVFMVDSTEKSEECSSELADSHDMCSIPLRCTCVCHNIPPGQTGFHTCNSCAERAPNVNCDFVDSLQCPWGGMTCPRCGNGQLIHTKD